MRLQCSTLSGATLARLLALLLLTVGAHQAAAQQARPTTGVPAVPTPSLPAARPSVGTAATCFSASEPGVIIAGCDAALANRAAYTADQIGLALQRRGAARAVTGRLADAIADFRQMIQANFRPHEAHASIASLQAREGRLSDAEKSWREALRLNPSYGFALTGLGNTLIAAGRAREAVAHFDQAIATADSDVTAHFGKGLALHATGDLDGAIKSLGDALRLNPRLTTALYQRSQAYADKGDLASAQTDADTAVGIAQGQDRIRALTHRGRLRNGSRSHSAAAADCTEAAALADRASAGDVQDRAAAHLCLAVAQQSLGALDEAQQSYDRVLRLADRDAAAYAGRGYVLLQRGRFDAALADFNAALGIDPGSQDALRFLGLTYADKGDRAKALEIFARTIAADARDPWPLMLRAITFAKDGDRQRASRDVEAAFRLTGQQSSDAHLVRGAVGYFLEDFTAARADLDTALRLNGDNAQAHRMLARLLIRTGRLEEAGRALDAAARQLPGDSTVLLNRGLLAHARRDFAATVRELSQSLAINGAQAEGFAVRGQAHEALGQTELALADYRAALANPATDADGRSAHAVARERLAQLTRQPSPAGQPAPRPPQPARTTGAERPSAYCRVVEGIFSHSRKYTGVDFDLGCGSGS